MTSRLRDFTRINPDLQEFINEVSKILLAIGLTTSEKAKLATNQLKDMAQAWYVHWMDNRP